LDNPDLWYSKAKESELVSKITKAYHETGTTPSRSFVPYRSMSTQPTTGPRNTPEEQSITGNKSPSTPTQTPAKPQTDRPKYKLRLNCWSCGKEGHPSWLCPDQEPGTKDKIRASDLLEEEIRALAELAMELVNQEHEAEQAEQGF
jgi:hypothetical protein